LLISGGTKKDSVLTTDTLYYTPIGESELPWGTEEPKLSGHVEVWQCMYFTDHECSLVLLAIKYSFVRSDTYK
jgi:hypothetical protein